MRYILAAVLLAFLGAIVVFALQNTEAVTVHFLNWRVTVMCMDALEWAQSPLSQRYDLCVTTLFLHHFERNELVRLLAGIATQADAFIACEPRRSGIARMGSRLIGLLGANEVTREDSVKSVAAGFKDLELTELWSKLPGDWRIAEYSAWPFTHCFRATRANFRAAAIQHER